MPAMALGMGKYNRTKMFTPELIRALNVAVPSQLLCLHPHHHLRTYSMPYPLDIPLTKEPVLSSRRYGNELETTEFMVLTHHSEAASLAELQKGMY